MGRPHATEKPDAPWDVGEQAAARVNGGGSGVNKPSVNWGDSGVDGRGVNEDGGAGVNRGSGDEGQSERRSSLAEPSQDPCYAPGRPRWQSLAWDQVRIFEPDEPDSDPSMSRP